MDSSDIVGDISLWFSKELYTSMRVIKRQIELLYQHLEWYEDQNQPYATVTVLFFRIHS